MKSEVYCLVLLMFCRMADTHASDKCEVVSDYLHSIEYENVIVMDRLAAELYKRKKTPEKTLASILQNGDSHYAKIVQTDLIEKQGANNACIVQDGSANSAVIEQSGNDNVNILLQCGNNNSGKQKTDGDRNLTLLGQFGQNNKSVQIVTGDDISSCIMQYGSDNQIYRVENSQGGLGYRITQDGNGMRMNVINGR
ncbi:MAG: hypothetical protein JW915_11460 [Chitinispirillaceae bacterium]|nr:hypothetical protein [Chitinispirillaceae bacterium]